MTREDIARIIKESRISAGLTQLQVAEALNRPQATIAGWEVGRSQPDANTLFDLFRVLGRSVDEAFGFTKEPFEVTATEREYIKKYRALDHYGKDAVNDLLNTEYKRIIDQEKDDIHPERSTKIIPLISNSFAAGRGEPDFGNPWEDYEVPIDTEADFAVRINGDSMEPYLPDKSIQLCRKGDPADGDVAVLVVDGEFLCKQVCEDLYHNLYLFSLNRARSDADQTIRHDSGREVSCFGTVILPHKIPLPA